MSASGNYLDIRDIDTDLPTVTMRGLRYHTIDGVEHTEGEEYDLDTTVGIASTLIACQFADFVELPPDPAPATGAVAGSPGTWTPPGSTPPADLSAMAAVTATPTTAWTTGQHMILADASHCAWDGAAWVAGDAAASHG